MKKQYDLVVFDWEGTLAEDTYGIIISIVAKEVINFQLDGFDKLIARRYVSLGLSSMVTKLFPDLSIHRHEQFIEIIQERLTRDANKVFLTEGAENTVKQINNAGIKLAIASNKGLKSLQRVLQLSGLDKYFKFIKTATDTKPKPCPQMLEEIMFLSGSNNETTLMVGDSTSDMEMAKSINVDVIGVDFYHEQTDALLEAGANFVLDDYKKLLQYLKIFKGDFI